MFPLQVRDGTATEITSAVGADTMPSWDQDGNLL